MHVPDIALRSIEGHLTRTGTQVMAWYRLAAQAWSFRSDSRREVLIRQIAAQLGELQGWWIHLRVTTRPYPVHTWAESFDNNALGRMPDVAGALGWAGSLEGEQHHLMGLVDVGQGGLPRRRGLRPQHGGSLGRRRRPGARQVRARRRRAELLASESVVPGAVTRWETVDLAAFSDGVDMYQEPYVPTVKVVGRIRSQIVSRNVAVLSVGLMEGLRIPEVDYPWMQHSDRLPFLVEWSARIYISKPEEVAGELQRQMGKVRSQIRHYTYDHDLDPPMSLARQRDRLPEVEDELTSGLTQLNTRLYGWWRIAVSGTRGVPLTRVIETDDFFQSAFAVVSSLRRAVTKEAVRG